MITAAENAERLRMLFAEVISEQHYDDVRRVPDRRRVVQQHTLRATAKTGATYETGVCLVVKVVQGRVQRLDEYLDSSVLQFAAPDSDATA